MTAAGALRVLATGGGGQVGRELARRGAAAGAGVAALPRAELDIADPAAIRAALDRLRPDVVVNAAAYTAVDRAESEPDAAFAANRDGAANVARACAAAGVPLVHISTDYVFDGTKDGPWTEDDAPNPLGVYGRSKLAGEAAARAAHARLVVLRTSWVYAAHGGNFARTMLRLGAERDRLRVVDDQRGAPTFAGDIADAALAVARRIAGRADAPWGLYHYAARGETTWRGFAEAILEAAAPALGRRPVVEPIATAEYPTPAARPANSTLDCARIDAAFAPPRRCWREGLAEVLDELLEGRGNRAERRRDG